MENKKKISNLLIKKSQDRLVKALDKLESVIANKINLAHSASNLELTAMRSELNQMQLKNKELSFALERLTINTDIEHYDDNLKELSLDNAIESIEKILKVKDADN
jgi:hypothetical protein